MRSPDPVVIQESSPSQSGDLTARERLILDLNAQGWTQARIAAHIGSKRGVVARALRRLKSTGHDISFRNSSPPKLHIEITNMIKSGMSCRDVSAKLGMSLASVQYFCRKAKRQGVSIPQSTPQTRQESGFERMTKELRSIRAPAIDWSKHPRFEDVHFKGDLD